MEKNNAYPSLLSIPINSDRANPDIPNSRIFIYGDRDFGDSGDGGTRSRSRHSTLSAINARHRHVLHTMETYNDVYVYYHSRIRGIIPASKFLLPTLLERIIVT